MSERQGEPWSASPRPRLAYDSTATSAPASKWRLTASQVSQNEARDRDLIDRLAAALEVDSIALNEGRAATVAMRQNEDRDRDPIDMLIVELDEAHARIEELETEADERLNAARIQIRAEIGAA